MPATVHTTDLVQVSIVIGAGLPVVAAVFKQDGLSRRTNTVIAVGVTLVAALVTVAVRHELTLWNAVASFAASYTAGVAFHSGLWQPTGIARRVQRHTSIWRRRPPRGPTPLTVHRTSRTRTDRSRDLSRC